MQNTTFRKRVFKEVDNLRQMLLLRKSGWPYEALANLYGCDFSTIYYWCKKYKGFDRQVKQSINEKAIVDIVQNNPIHQPIFIQKSHWTGNAKNLSIQTITITPNIIGIITRRNIIPIEIKTKKYDTEDTEINPGKSYQDYLNEYLTRKNGKRN